MEQSSWLVQLQEAVVRKAEQIEGKEMPRLKEIFGIYQTYFENVYNIMIKKSLIQEDPYKYDEKISEVATPSKDEFLESEKQDQMSQRMSSFQSQLEFLTTYYQFSLDFLDLGRIKRILGLLDYFSWHRLGDAKSTIVSKVLDDFATKVRLGTDKMSTQILADSITQLESHTKEIKRVLKQATNFHRESYKLELRRNVFSKLDLQGSNVETAVKAIRQNFAKNMEGFAFYAELAQEVAREELTPAGPELKEGVLKKLAVESETTGKPKKQKSFKEQLMQAVRYMGSTGFQLEDIAGKLIDNHAAFSSRKLSLGEKMGRFFRRLSGNREESHVYEIEYLDVSTSTTRSESVSFNTFIEELHKKAKVYASLTNRSGPPTRRLEGASEEKIFDFLTRQLANLETLHRQLTGFNEFFKAEMPEEARAKYRGLRVELSAVKNSMIKANQARHEYIATKEEQEQMKKLGIKLD